MMTPFARALLCVLVSIFAPSVAMFGLLLVAHVAIFGFVCLEK